MADIPLLVEVAKFQPLLRQQQTQLIGLNGVVHLLLAHMLQYLYQLQLVPIIDVQDDIRPHLEAR